MAPLPHPRHDQSRYAPPLPSPIPTPCPPPQSHLHAHYDGTAEEALNEAYNTVAVASVIALIATNIIDYLYAW